MTINITLKAELKASNTEVLGGMLTTLPSMTDEDFKELCKQANVKPEKLYDTEKGYDVEGTFEAAGIHFRIYNRYGVYRVGAEDSRAIEVIEALGFDQEA